jgi:hypothetical protein
VAANCKNCRTKFVKIRSNQRYCSARCRRRERRHRRQLTPHGLARRRERNRKRYAANPEKYRERAKRSAADPEKRPERLARRRELDRKRRAANPERYRTYERRYNAAHPGRHQRYYAANPEKYRQYGRERLATHREEINEKRRKRYAANPEQRKKKNHEWYTAHREEVKEKRRKRRAANPEKERERDRKRYAANPGKRRAISRKTYHAHREEIRERVQKQRTELLKLAAKGKIVDEIPDEQLHKIKRGQLMPRPVSPGRPKVAPEKRHYAEIGRAVEDFMPRAGIALQIIDGMPSHERASLETLRAKLQPLGFLTKEELQLAQFATTAKLLARSIVAARNRSTVEAVERSHQKLLRSKVR